MEIKLFKLSDILQFEKKSHRKAGDGLEVGKYPFFTSSQQQSKWLDKADYLKESIILGTGGIPSVHFSEKFSTSADIFILTSKEDNILIKYIIFYFL